MKTKYFKGLKDELKVHLLEFFAFIASMIVDEKLKLKSKKESEQQ